MSDWLVVRSAQTGNLSNWPYYFNNTGYAKELNEVLLAQFVFFDALNPDDRNSLPGTRLKLIRLDTTP